MKNKVIDEFLLEKQIEQDEFSVVYLAKSKVDNKNYAVKSIPNEIFVSHPKLQEQISNELSALKLLNNTQNIVRFKKFLKTKHNYYLVYEHCSQGSLSDLLQISTTLSQFQTLMILSQLLNGLKEMHSKNIIHRDLKPANILFNDQQIKIANFTSSKISIIAKNEERTYRIGTMPYTAPELSENISDGTQKSDIYSLGVIAYEMLFGIFPFEGKSVEELIKTSKCETKINFDRNIKHITLGMEKILRGLLEKNPENRITLEDLEKMITSEIEKNNMNNSSSEYENDLNKTFSLIRNEFLKALMQERKKNLLMNEYLSQTLQLNLTQSNILIVFQILKKIAHFYQKIRYSLQNELETYFFHLMGYEQKSEFFIFLKESNEYKSFFSTMINEENLIIETFFKLKMVVDSEESLSNNFPGLIKETISEYDPNGFNENLFKYIKDLIKLESSEIIRDLQRKYFIFHLFISLELINLEEFYPIFLEKNYLNLGNMCDEMSEDDLNKAIREKMKIFNWS